MSLEPHAPSHTLEAITAFLRAHAKGPGREGVVIGLSGGIDSALSARLARDALGADAVLGVLLPDSAVPTGLVEETEGYARELGIRSRTIPIDTVETRIRELLPEVQDRGTWGNTKARIRMILLYNLAREEHRLVVGTGNKSELLLGYFTKWGDGGADLLPLGDLYKTGVRELAAELELPRAIRERAPTAGLWEGQTDEGELGLPYDRIDRILLGLEQLRGEAEIVRITGETPETVRRILQRVDENRHKRRPPPIPKLSLRTIGLDWRD